MSLEAFEAHLPVRNESDPQLLKVTAQGFGLPGVPSGLIMTIQGHPNGSPITVIGLDEANADGVPSGYISNSGGGGVALGGGATGVIAELNFTTNGYVKKLHFSCGALAAFDVRIGTDSVSAIPIPGIQGLTSTANKRDEFEFAIPRSILAGNSVFVFGKNGDSSPTTIVQLNAYIEGYRASP